MAGVLADKDRHGFFRAMAPVARRCWTVPVACGRGSDPAELAGLAASAGIEATAADTVGTAVREAVAWARGVDGWVCIAGSLYLAGEVLAQHAAEGDGGCGGGSGTLISGPRFGDARPLGDTMDANG